VPRSQREQGSGRVEEWVHAPVRITFETGSDLDDGDRAMLQELVAVLSQRADVVRVRVEGHAIVEWENAEGLALARAQRVVDFLVGDGGLPRELFEAVDDGGDYSDAGAMDRVQWQRVEFSLLVRRGR
jgi:outer membrane protein OmpA-like peptidoglycan-associated protein